jgi:hypothetical protein
MKVILIFIENDSRSEASLIGGASLIYNIINLGEKWQIEQIIS